MDRYSGSWPGLLRSWIFRPEDHARYEELSAKRRAGMLSASEADLLDDYLHVDSLIAILRSKMIASGIFPGD